MDHQVCVHMFLQSVDFTCFHVAIASLSQLGGMPIYQNGYRWETSTGYMGGEPQSLDRLLIVEHLPIASRNISGHQVPSKVGSCVETSFLGILLGLQYCTKGWKSQHHSFRCSLCILQGQHSSSLMYQTTKSLADSSTSGSVKHLSHFD